MVRDLNLRDSETLCISFSLTFPNPSKFPFVKHRKWISHVFDKWTNVGIMNIDSSSGWAITNKHRLPLQILVWKLFRVYPIKSNNFQNRKNIKSPIIIHITKLKCSMCPFSNMTSSCGFKLPTQFYLRRSTWRQTFGRTWMKRKWLKRKGSIETNCAPLNQRKRGSISFKMRFWIKLRRRLKNETIWKRELRNCRNKKMSTQSFLIRLELKTNYQLQGIQRGRLRLISSIFLIILWVTDHHNSIKIIFFRKKSRLLLLKESHQIQIEKIWKAPAENEFAPSCFRNKTNLE